MKITIHQPEHFPYMGFFQKMESADLFVILDDVQYTKNNFQNRNKFLNKKFHIIGSAHNQLEYYFKRRQGCKIISLSPIFFNPKYSKNKILSPIKFNIICKNWDGEICALGGVNSANLKKINLTRSSSIAFQRYVLE